LTFNDIIRNIEAKPLCNGRRIIAVAGAPASGKSTFAQALAQHAPMACVVPMDGFHYSNEILKARGLLSKKGAPNTFDVEAFIALVKAIRSGGTIEFPTFDRIKDCVVKQGGRLPAQTQTVIVEGNYLLLDNKPWSDLVRLWDLTLLLDVAIPVLRQRLIARWLDNGHDLDAARLRVSNNDIPNAQTIIDHSCSADLVIKS
jgi:pantothenate kinase